LAIVTAGATNVNRTASYKLVLVEEEHVLDPSESRFAHNDVGVLPDCAARSRQCARELLRDYEKPVEDRREKSVSSAAALAISLGIGNHTTVVRIS